MRLSRETPTRTDSGIDAQGVLARRGTLVLAAAGVLAGFFVAWTALSAAPNIVNGPGSLGPLTARAAFANSMPADWGGSWEHETEGWQHAVVRVETNRCGDRIEGTGVIVGDRVLTNGHVVDGATDVRVITADGRHHMVGAIGRSSSVDVARLVLADRGDAGLPDGLSLGSETADQLYSTYAGAAGDDPELWLAGFPGARDFVSRPVSAVGVVASTVRPEPARSVRLDVTVVGGESGSPVVTDAGEVVALVYGRSLLDGSGLAIGAAELRTAIDGATTQPWTTCH